MLFKTKDQTPTKESILSEVDSINNSLEQVTEKVQVLLDKLYEELESLKGERFIVRHEILKEFDNFKLEELSTPERLLYNEAHKNLNIDAAFSHSSNLRDRVITLKGYEAAYNDELKADIPTEHTFHFNHLDINKLNALIFASLSQVQPELLEKFKRIKFVESSIREEITELKQIRFNLIGKAKNRKQAY
ncbi:hypothetical protein ACM65P_002638 [Vibrio alginolyticus]